MTDKERQLEGMKERAIEALADKIAAVLVAETTALHQQGWPETETQEICDGALEHCKAIN